jgi:hypothetical protein
MCATDERVETAAQLIHEQRHQAGADQICSDCRDLAERIACLYGTAGD